MLNIQQPKIYSFSVVVEKDEDGYFAYVPLLPGCHTQGDTYEEAMANIREAMEAYLASMAKHGEEIPTEKDVVVSLSRMELALAL